MVMLWLKCPYNKSVLNFVLRLAMMVFSTVGLYFLNLWVAVVYLIYYVVWSFLLMPLKHCQNCYYMVKETTTDEKTGKTRVNLLPKDKWVESCLEKHVACGKKWGFNFFVSWLVPIVLISISFFLNFSIFALISLIGFIGALAGSLVYMRYKICPKCAIVEECHESF